MLINRHNYEEYFLLYVDNELSAADRKAVEAFVEENPDLEEELVMMMQSVMRPDPKLVFTNKESLLKNIPANGLVNESNYEEYFVMYGDNELSNEEKDLVEQFVYKHPQYQAEFELIQQARLLPDHGMVYPDKNELYRTEEDERVIPFRWWKMAAAAIVLLFLGVTAWYMMQEKQAGNATDPQIVKETKDSNNKNNQGSVPGTVKEKEESAAADIRNNLASVEDKIEEKEKKSGIKSNIDRIRFVPQQREIEKNDMAANDQVKKVEQKEIDPLPLPEEIKALEPAYANVVANTGDPRTEVATLTNVPGAAIANTQQPVIYYTDDEEEIKLANTSINKKPVRGLIRKVKGLLDGNNEENEQPEQEEKKGIRIAAFSIALK